MDVLDTAAVPGHPRVTRERWLAVWMPNLALMVCLLTLVYVLLFFDGWHKLFRDSDTGWHIRTGEGILVNRALPRTDPYSFSRPGAPWIDWEWASDVLAGGAHRMAGLPGVAVLFAAAIAACSWLWFQLTWRVGGDFLLASVLAAPMLSTANMHWLARPHVFGWILLLVWMLWLERGRGLVGAVVIGAVWANLHASFFLAPVLALLYAAGFGLAQWIWNEPRMPGQYVKAAIFVSLGTLLNPYGIGLHRHLASYLGDSELLSRIGEFQSFNFHAAGSGWILATVGIAGLGGVLALGHQRVEHFLVAAFFIALALRSARALPVLALCVLPIANAGIAGALERSSGLAPWLRRRLDAALEYSSRLRELDIGLSGWATALVVMLAVLFTARNADAGFPGDQFPVVAAEAVSQLPLEARILAPDKFGGYLIYRFDGKRKVFFDGRSDFYGAPFMKQYLRLMEARPGWRETMARYRFTHALLPDDHPLIAALGVTGWTPIHKDATATLLAAPVHNDGP